ncbi:MAG: pantetheine-phosphate adenylyltransferase [Planctomycetota bacterium]
MRTAIYPGSFDPITYGHLDVIRRGSKIFDELVVAIARHPIKEPLFTPEERKTMIMHLAKDLPNVRVVIFDGLMINLAKKENACSFLRGIRTFSDFEYEFQMAFTNRSLAPEIETVFVMPSEDYSFLSSSMVKQAFALGGDLSRLVPQNVISCLSRKIKKEKEN